MSSERSPNASSIADHLDRTARRVREVLWEMEDPRGGVINDGDLERKLVYFLKQLRVQSAIALDRLGLHVSRADLDEAWREFVKSGLQKVVFYPEPGAVGSYVYDYLDSVIEGIRGLEPDSARVNDIDKELRRLELLLRRTAYILQERRVIPSKEGDVQKVMDHYLDVIYGGDYRRQFSIPGAIKNFKPDSGVRSLKAVIEFKFAASPQELKTETSGLFEDSAAYKASADWDKYYSVVYMTGAHGTEEKLLAAFEQAGMIAWTPILVTGAGGRIPKRVAQTAALTPVGRRPRKSGIGATP